MREKKEKCGAEPETGPAPMVMVSCDLFSEISSGFEFNHLAGCDLDFFFCAGVDACTSLFLNYGESTEADKLNLIVVGKSLLN